MKTEIYYPDPKRKYKNKLKESSSQKWSSKLYNMCMSSGIKKYE